ncbi:MAG: Panacea domain-containing protein [Candidatus Zixiibacteriota bacterium]
MAERIDDLDRLKAAKLLYFVDKQAIKETGRPILGDTYVKMELGPVPSRAYDLIKEIGGAGMDRFGITEVSDPTKSKYPVFRSCSHPNRDVFSEAELRCIESVVVDYGKLSGTRLSDIAHSQRAWLETQGRDIDYMLFLDDPLGTDKEIAELMLIEQENRDFSSYL